ncbi:hypothetical protein QTO34_012552 [Cnephaeus nilssonii]|uniref:Uncharacterized protein n=1 Tax=Cnephaeus nilssonii TaxID=3371016 RepID=A0AA40HBL9_CNENI|nr:hypothetical protein QTO34_012552 [Eptesicus nilssonii]
MATEVAARAAPTGPHHPQDPALMRPRGVHPPSHPAAPVEGKGLALGRETSPAPERGGPRGGEPPGKAGERSLPCGQPGSGDPEAGDRPEERTVDAQGAGDRSLAGPGVTQSGAPAAPEPPQCPTEWMKGLRPWACPLCTAGRGEAEAGIPAGGTLEPLPCWEAAKDVKEPQCLPEDGVGVQPGSSRAWLDPMEEARLAWTCGPGVPAQGTWGSPPKDRATRSSPELLSPEQKDKPLPREACGPSKSLPHGCPGGWGPGGGTGQPAGHPAAEETVLLLCLLRGFSSSYEDSEEDISSDPERCLDPSAAFLHTLDQQKPRVGLRRGEVAAAGLMGDEPLSLIRGCSRSEEDQSVARKTGVEGSASERAWTFSPPSQRLGDFLARPAGRPSCLGKPSDFILNTQRRWLYPCDLAPGDRELFYFCSPSWSEVLGPQTMFAPHSHFGSRSLDVCLFRKRRVLWMIGRQHVGPVSLAFRGRDGGQAWHPPQRRAGPLGGEAVQDRWKVLPAEGGRRALPRAHSDSKKDMALCSCRPFAF